jgi:hypothetical protein
MKVSQLTGSALDHWVAKAHGWKLNAAGSVVQFVPAACYDPSRDWSLGGRIVARLIDLGMIFMRESPGGDVRAIDAFGMMEGATMLECACRAKVKQQFGDEVPNDV